ncbi:hypothetical protein Ddc_18398 [Ditylenchus destructor]|nr:hypothetical protein Ddc_18398 [Ditylenchus destructor]
MNGQRPSTRLYLSLVRDTLAFFNRLDLCHLLTVNRRFNSLIDNQFFAKPYLLLRELSYINRRWEWIKTDGPPVPLPQDVLIQLPASKFVRFEIVHFEPNSPDDQPGFSSYKFYILTLWHIMNPVLGFMLPTRTANETFETRVMLPIRHVWEGQYLEYAGMYRTEIVPTAECARSLAKSDRFTSMCTGIIGVLGELVSGNCKWICAMDKSHTLEDMPWAKIADFLFKGNGVRGISLCTRRLPQRTQFVQFLEEVKERFHAATISPTFFFNMVSDETWESEPVEYRGHNSKIDQYFMIKIYPTGFLVNTNPFLSKQF